MANSNRAAAIRNFINAACEHVSHEPYGTLPTLHAHSQMIDALLKAMKAIHHRHLPQLKDEHMFSDMFELAERFRDIVARLRLDPELSTDDAYMSLSLIMRLFHATQCGDGKPSGIGIFENIGYINQLSTEAVDVPINILEWIRYYMTPWQPLLGLGSKMQELDIPWQLQHIYEVMCSENAIVIDSQEHATEANGASGQASSRQHHLTRGSDKMTTQQRGELALLYAETIARTVRHSVAMQMEVPAALPALDMETAIESLVGRADAELGAQVFRDLVLSFTLPRGVVGLRHTLLLSRNTSTIATKNHGDLVGHAHCAALQGPSRVWQHGVLSAQPMLNDGAGQAPGEKTAQFLHTAERLHQEAEEAERLRMNNQDCIAAAEMERSCVLLAGLAMLFAPSSSEARKGLAFQGRVRLPFFSVPLERTDVKSSIELMTDGSWCYFEPQNERLVLKYKGDGLEAVKVVCTLLMLDASR